jgi:hypothetical protein
MFYMVGRFLTISFLLLFLCAVTSCDTEKEEVADDYKNYRFDPRVIEKIPIYDSIAAAIIQSFPSFQKYIRDEDSYRSFRYMPSSDDADVFIKLPPEAGIKIDPYFNQLGKDFIYGFDVFRDSSIKIYVRTNFSGKSQVDIVENLSYYPAGNIRRREFPERDTVLNKNWQYWVRFSKRGLF